MRLFVLVVVEVNIICFCSLYLKRRRERSFQTYSPPVPPNPCLLYAHLQDTTLFSLVLLAFNSQLLCFCTALFHKHGVVPLRATGRAREYTNCDEVSTFSVRVVCSASIQLPLNGLVDVGNGGGHDLQLWFARAATILACRHKRRLL